MTLSIFLLPNVSFTLVESISEIRVISGLKWKMK